MSDLIRREAVIDALYDWSNHSITDAETWHLRQVIGDIKSIPSAEPEPEAFEWCHDCKEYDQEKHCCHRWTKVIRQTVEKLKAQEPERKKGKWVYKPNEYDDNTYECSQCGEPWTLIDGTPEENNMKFCPNCGAEMTRGEHGQA